LTDFYLIRHGETDWNRAGRFQGHTDIPLNARGRDQAARVAARLAGAAIGSVYASDLSRAVATAAPLAQRLGLDVQTSARLRERSYGVFEGLTLTEIENHFPLLRAQWATRDPDFTVPQGESLRAFDGRVSEAMREIAALGHVQPVCIVTHGGVLDAIYRQASGMPVGAPRRWPMRNAALNQVRVEAGVITVLSWGDASHLDEGAP